MIGNFILARLRRALFVAGLPLLVERAHAHIQSLGDRLSPLLVFIATHPRGLVKDLFTVGARQVLLAHRLRLHQSLNQVHPAVTKKIVDVFHRARSAGNHPRPRCDLHLFAEPFEMGHAPI